METGDKPFPILALIAALLTAWLIAVDVRIAAADGDLAPLSTVGVPPRIGGTIINNAPRSDSARRCSGIPRPAATVRSPAPRVTSTPAPSYVT